jgi:translation elongation factor P/translation initiation factor 5A
MIGVKELDKGKCIINRGEPAKVLKRENVTAGTHMHTKVKLTVQGLFSGRTEVLTLTSHEMMEDVDIVNKRGQVISKEPLQVMDLVSYETVEMDTLPELKGQINESDTVSYIEFQGKRVITEKR